MGLLRKFSVHNLSKFSAECGSKGPGGWLQWDEADLGKTIIKGEKAEKFMEVAQSIFQKLGFDFS